MDVPTVERRTVEVEHGIFCAVSNAVVLIANYQFAWCQTSVAANGLVLQFVAHSVVDIVCSADAVVPSGLAVEVEIAFCLDVAIVVVGLHHLSIVEALGNARLAVGAEEGVGDKVAVLVIGIFPSSLPFAVEHQFFSRSVVEGAAYQVAFAVVGHARDVNEFLARTWFAVDAESGHLANQSQFVIGESLAGETIIVEHGVMLDVVVHVFDEVADRVELGLDAGHAIGIEAEVSGFVIEPLLKVVAMLVVDIR